MDRRTHLLAGPALLAAVVVLWRVWPEGVETSAVAPAPHHGNAKVPTAVAAPPRGASEGLSIASRRASAPTPPPTDETATQDLARPARARLADVLAQPETRPRELLTALVAAIAEQEVALGRGIPWTAGAPIQPLLQSTVSSFVAVHSHAGSIHTVTVHQGHYPAVFALIGALDETPLLGPLDKESEHHRSASALLADLQQP